jgi:poly-gamma-glutamate capsule biosynthesis protein CapA/YwtB (metallophosphatase superfamily)
MNRRASVKTSRRDFLTLSLTATLGVLAAGQSARPVPTRGSASLGQATYDPSRNPEFITLFLCGDVMTGRGIDQILPYPSSPRLHEPYVATAQAYVELAERANGSIPEPVDFAYVWGDALAEFQQIAPDVRIINLETAVTASVDYWKAKGIHYRMHPANLPCLTAARIDCCVLANNHVLDWGYKGLVSTLETLRRANLRSIGAGRDLREAEAPAVVEVSGKGGVVVFAFGCESSGIPPNWAAAENRPGVNLLRDLSPRTVKYIANQVRAVKRSGDIVVASIHWGGNWGYGIPREQRAFAHQLIDEASVDVVHGHSSHHPKGIEVYQNKPLLYGCGDFLNDYEGISGYEGFRDDLVLMYFVTLNPLSGKLVRLEMMPMQIKRFRLNRPSDADVHWLRTTLDRESKKLGAAVELAEKDRLRLRWE